MKERDRRILDGDFDFLRKVVVEGIDVVTDDELGADCCEEDVLEEEEDVTEKGAFKRDVRKKVERMYAATKTKGDFLGRKKTFEGEEEVMRISAKVFLCGDEIEEEDVLTIKNKIWSTGRGEEIEERRELEELAEMGLEWKVVLKR